MYDYFDYEDPQWQKGYHCVMLGNRKTAKEIIAKNAGKKIWYLIERDVDRSGRGMFWARRGVLIGKMINSRILLQSGYDSEIHLKDIRDFAIED